MSAVQVDKINGILLLDKPCGKSSNQILQTVKKIFSAKKAGHTGSLDPSASGMLPICFGEATKFSQFLLNSEKKYLVILKLGKTTSTFDSDGEILLIRNINVDIQKLKTVLNTFTGHIKQKPPMYSAIKYKGKPLYFYARKKIIINRKDRTLFVRKIKLLNYYKDLVKLEIVCSKGTYIRSLVHDIGEKLECGAHVFFLRRLKVANYSQNQLINFKILELLHNYSKKFGRYFFVKKKLKSFLLPIDNPLYFLKKLELNKENEQYFKNGMRVSLEKKVKINTLIRVYSKKTKNFIGIGTVIDNFHLTPKRLIQ